MAESEAQCGDKCHFSPSAGLYTANGATALLLSSAAYTHTHSSLAVALEQLALWWLRACEMSFCQVN